MNIGDGLDTRQIVVTYYHLLKMEESISIGIIVVVMVAHDIVVAITELLLFNLEWLLLAWSGPELSSLSYPLVAHPLDAQSCGTGSVQRQVIPVSIVQEVVPEHSRSPGGGGGQP